MYGLRATPHERDVPSHASGESQRQGAQLSLSMDESWAPAS
jgi:hypothetical protein